MESHKSLPIVMKFATIGEEIADILGIENNDYWEVIDSIPEIGLYQIHYTPGADMSKYGHLRGVIIDLPSRTIVAKSFGYTPTVYLDVLTPSSLDLLTLVDTYGLRYEVPVFETRLTPGYEGEVFQIFKHRGKVYHSTFRKIQGESVKVGTSPSLIDIYRKLGGPSENQLFDPQSFSSPYCHVFYLIHPSLLLSSKQEVGDGYLVYDGPRVMYDLEESNKVGLITDRRRSPRKSQIKSPTKSPMKSPTKSQPGKMETKPKNVKVVDDLPAIINSANIYQPRDLSLEDANDHLKYGFYEFSDEDFPDDPRLGTGEFVFVHQIDENNNIKRSFRIEGSAYQWRSTMRDGNLNVYQQLFYHLNGARINLNDPNILQAYMDRYPLLTPYSIENLRSDIKKNGNIVVWQQDPDVEIPLATQEDRFQNIFYGYLLSLPLHLQLYALDLYQQLYGDQQDVILWLQEISSNQALPELSTRGKEIIAEAKKTAMSQPGKSISDQINTNIKTLIHREEGGSLYRLVKEMLIANY